MRDVVFRTDRTGAALTVSPYHFGADGGADPDIWPLLTLSTEDDDAPCIGFDWQGHNTDGVTFVPVDVDGIGIVNEDAHIRNDFRYSRVDGTQQVVEQAASIRRFGRRTYSRSDLQCRTDETARLLAQFESERQALNSLRVEEIQIATSDRGDDTYLAVLAADIGVKAIVLPPDNDTGTDRPGRIDGYVRSITHQITQRNPGHITWATTFNIDTETVSGLPAAQLPSST